MSASEATLSNVAEAIKKMPPLDESFYSLSPEESEFLKNQTGIQDDESLKQHILAVQKEAYSVFPYMCIRIFWFLRLNISRLPAYRELLALGKENPRAIFLDLACCFGNDIRKAVADGYPVQNAIAADIVGEFWNLGHKLYNSTPESFPAAFVQGDVFDPGFITPASPLTSPPKTPRPELTTLDSLTPLQGHVYAIHVSAFFHLFDEDGQRAAARKLASLLAPVRGAMIFGVHLTRDVSGKHESPRDKGTFLYSFSSEDWQEMWKDVFSGIEIEVSTVIYDKAPLLKEKWNEDISWSQGRRPMSWCLKRL